MIMWHIQEHRQVEKACQKLPQQVLQKYELWKSLVYRHGPEKLKEFPGFQDEALKGLRQGQRSSRLSLKYQIIYEVEKAVVTVFILEITPHQY